MVASINLYLSNKMNKKIYQKPSMKVVVLSHHTAILQTSGVEATRSGYDPTTPQNWDVSE